MYFYGSMTQYGACIQVGGCPTTDNTPHQGHDQLLWYLQQRRPDLPGRARHDDRHELELVRERAMDRDTTGLRPPADRWRDPHAAGGARCWPPRSCSPRSAASAAASAALSEPAPIARRGGPPGRRSTAWSASGMPADHPKIEPAAGAAGDRSGPGTSADAPPRAGRRRRRRPRGGRGRGGDRGRGRRGAGGGPRRRRRHRRRAGVGVGRRRVRARPRPAQRRRRRRGGVRQRAPARRDEPLRGRRPGRDRALGPVRARTGRCGASTTRRSAPRAPRVHRHADARRATSTVVPPGRAPLTVDVR